MRQNITGAHAPKNNELVQISLKKRPFLYLKGVICNSARAVCKLFPVLDNEKTMAPLKVSSRIPWKIAQTPDGWWVGYSPMLKITAQGKTQKELSARIFETQELLFEDLAESGEFETFLAAHGWMPVSNSNDKSDGHITLEELEEIPISMEEVDARNFEIASC